MRGGVGVYFVQSSLQRIFCQSTAVLCPRWMLYDERERAKRDVDFDALIRKRQHEILDRYP